MEVLIRCKRCKNFYVFFGSIWEASVCPECLLLELEEYAAVRDYVREHKGCTIGEVCLQLSVPVSRITQYLKEERLEIVGIHNFLRCEICGSLINMGRFCQNCSKKDKQTACPQPKA